MLAGSPRMGESECSPGASYESIGEDFDYNENPNPSGCTQEASFVKILTPLQAIPKRPVEGRDHT